MIKKLISILVVTAYLLPLNAMEEISKGEGEGHRAGILTLDGGGMRGAFQLKVIHNVCTELNIKPEQTFNLISGTSIGGVHALGLGSGIETSELLQLYTTAPQIIFEAQYSFFGLYRPKYSADGLEGYLKKLFGVDTQLNTTNTNVLIPFYDTCRGLSIPMCSWDPYTGLVKKWDAGRATTAAPTYFLPHQFYIRPEDTNINNLFSAIDGGMGLNNPTALAVNTLEKDIDHMKGMENVSRTKKPFVLSIGTGTIQPLYPDEINPTHDLYPYPVNSTYLTYDQVSRFGLMEWAENIIEILMDATSEGMEAIAARYCEAQYHRIQAQFPASHISIDDYSEENVAFLLKAADALQDTKRYQAIREALKRFIDENKD